MVNTNKEAEKQVREINTQLEQKVRGRTRDLEEEIQERKRNQEALQQSEETFRSLSENSQDFIMRYHEQCRHLYQNEAGCRLFDFTEEGFIGEYTQRIGF